MVTYYKSRKLPNIYMITTKYEKNQKTLSPGCYTTFFHWMLNLQVYSVGLTLL